MLVFRFVDGVKVKQITVQNEEITTYGEGKDISISELTPESDCKSTTFPNYNNCFVHN